jgi:hypothetical protein
MANKNSSKSPKKEKSSSSTVTKGRIVERIVALMHDQPGVTVQRNQFLPPVSGTGRKREIDVLITAFVVGYQVRLAVECKNEAKAIGSPMIDAFVGKLQHVGIPSQYGVYVSASGYTADAVERAKTAGIKTLTLHGLNADLLGSVSDAFQSTIYLHLQVLNEIVTSLTPPSEPKNLNIFGFYNEKGKLAALLPDLVWQAWIAGQLPLTLGEHEVDLPFPTKLHPEVNGSVVEISALTTKIRVTGLACCR